LTWLKLSLFDDDNIMESLSINKIDKDKTGSLQLNSGNEINSTNEFKEDLNPFEISLEKTRRKSEILEKNEEKLKESSLPEEENSNLLQRKQDFFHEILRESCVLEEAHFLKKPEKDLIRMSFLLENKVEEFENPDELGLNVYKHNTFINSIKMMEKKGDYLYDGDEKALNEIIRAITHYKVLTNSIEDHLKDKKMVLCCLKEKYVDYFINKYDKIISEKCFVQNESLYQQAIDEAFEDLEQFIDIFHQTIYYFYKIQYLDQKIQIEKSFFKPENLHNFLTSILMDRKIYSILYLSLIQSKENQEDSLRMALQFCKNFEPKDFDVPEKYCLDQRTIDFLAKKKVSVEESLFLKGLSQELENKNQFSFKTKTPYESAINCLKEMEFVRSPLHKLKVLVRTGDEILQNIEEFYQKFEFNYEKDSLSADDLLPIFTYVVAKSQVKCFYSQIKIIDELASRNLKNTLSGYYLVTLQIALNLIENCFKEGRKEKEKGEVFGSSVKSSFAENMGMKLNEFKENTGPKKSIFNIIKDL